MFLDTAAKIARLMHDDLPATAEEVPETPDLTVLFVVLICVLVTGLTVYVLVKLWMHSKKEQEILQRGMRAGMPHIKALDNSLPANSLNSLYDKDKDGKKK